MPSQWLPTPVEECADSRRELGIIPGSPRGKTNEWRCRRGTFLFKSTGRGLSPGLCKPDGRCQLPANRVVVTLNKGVWQNQSPHREPKSPSQITAFVVEEQTRSPLMGSALCT